MKKNIIYFVLALAVGVLGGYLLFGGNTAQSKSENHEHAEAATDQMWTCSMHPQIMQPEPGDCPLCGMDLIPAESGAEGLGADEIRMTKNAMALANIQTMVVGDMSDSEENFMTLSGKIMPNEEANAVQASYFEGRIEKLHINYTGEKVSKGQLLATIYAPSLVVTQQELLTTASLKASQPALYKSVRNKLKLLKLSDKQIDEIESSGKIREKFPVYATVSGTVSEKLAEEGDYVTQGQPIVKVSDLGTVWAMFDAYENQISQLKVGQKITVTTNAYPDKAFDATVSFIDPRLNTQSRTVSVRATLTNRGGILKPGMFAVGKLENKIRSEGQQLLVPATAVMWTGKRSLVYVKTNPNEPIFEVREVTLGQRGGDNYAIREGLKSGEEIVSYGTFTVDAAAQLQGKKSMMNTASQHSSDVEIDEKTGHPKMMDRIKVDKKFQNQLKVVFEDYIKLKDALVNDDPKTASQAAKAVGTSLSKIDKKLLTDNQASTLWTNFESGIQSGANKISSESDIKKQRKHFELLSSHLISAVETFGINQKVYRQYCPMVDGNKGAYWLSKENKVLNPYFGESMLTCGEVTNEIN
ncbi:MAG: efflux RND transporter periplasmic adaptor subunit [Weeksellaceae bacterium]